MKNQNQVSIFGKNYKIFEKNKVFNENGDACVGLIEFDSNIIFIESVSDKQKKTQILLHEMFHGVFDRIGLNHFISDEVEEIIVDSLSTVIVDNFNVSFKKK